MPVRLLKSKSAFFSVSDTATLLSKYGNATDNKPNVINVLIDGHQQK